MMSEAKKDEYDLSALLAGAAELDKAISDSIVFGSGAIIMNTDGAKHIPLKSLYKDKEDDDS